MRDRLSSLSPCPSQQIRAGQSWKAIFSLASFNHRCSDYFPETIARSPHRLPQYHSDRHSMLPNEKVLCPRKNNGLIYAGTQTGKIKSIFQTFFLRPRPYIISIVNVTAPLFATRALIQHGGTWSCMHTLYTAKGFCSRKNFSLLIRNFMWPITDQRIVSGGLIRECIRDNISLY